MNFIYWLYSLLLCIAFLLQTRPRALSEVEKVKEQLDNYEAKCLYCGRKMETILDQLQSCIEEFAIPDQHQDTVYLGIAGLKQVHYSSCRDYGIRTKIL